jgi:hypothetical protein
MLPPVGDGCYELSHYEPCLVLRHLAAAESPHQDYGTCE